MAHLPVTFEQLAAQITEEILDRLTRDNDATPLSAAMRTALRYGGQQLGIRAELSPEALDMASRIDHTLLKPEATKNDIEKLCQEAADYGFASVCVHPAWVRTAFQLLKYTPVAVCTVIGFPLGANASDVKAYEARRALFDGARELDMVLAIGALKSGDLKHVEHDIRAVVGVAREAGALCKVILETALLTDEEKITACQLAKTAGADFVKTSTGFSTGGATVEDIRLMRRTVGDTMGVKASGGIRDFAGAQAMLAAGATRIGASVGVKIVHGAPTNTGGLHDY